MNGGINATERIVSWLWMVVLKNRTHCQLAMNGGTVGPAYKKLAYSESPL